MVAKRKSKTTKSKKGSNRRKPSAKTGKVVKRTSAKKKSTPKVPAKKKVTKKTSSAQPTPRFTPSADDKNILKYMLLAMDTEKKGIKFYTKVKRTVKDYNMSKLMDVLIEQEQMHLMFFKEIYNAERKKGSADAGKVAGRYKGQKPVKSPMFKAVPAKKLRKKMKSIHDLFKEALEFEVHGHDMYLYMAKRVKNPNIKAFLKMVANEELKHRDFIHEHMDALYDTGYWLGLEHVAVES